MQLSLVSPRIRCTLSQDSAWCPACSKVFPACLMGVQPLLPTVSTGSCLTGCVMLVPSWRQDGHVEFHSHVGSSPSSRGLKGRLLCSLLPSSLVLCPAHSSCLHLVQRQVWLVHGHPALLPGAASGLLAGQLQDSPPASPLYRITIICYLLSHI